MIKFPGAVHRPFDRVTDVTVTTFERARNILRQNEGKRVTVLADPQAHLPTRTWNI